MNRNEKAVVVGAGLCGTLLALRLGQRGIPVHVVEKRPDPRTVQMAGGRSINLALSSRGFMALRMAGLEEKARAICMPMEGRMIHPLNESPFFSRYSARPEEYINSISRADLNILLLEEADTHPHVQLEFEARCTDIALKDGKISVMNGNTGISRDISGTAVFGTDGAGSVVRSAMRKDTKNLLFNYSQHFLRHGYKELTIPPASGGGFRIENNALHIWPRGNFMTIALPNLDGSFTVTMFHPYECEVGFNILDTSQKVRGFFKKYYPDLLTLIPGLDQEYFTNPTGLLGTIKCYPWQAYGKVCLMGDAAHAIVPFYGQGMNASFEDVRVFDDILEEYGTDWEKVFNTFQDQRVKNTDAIADLALDNFVEMRDRVDDPDFIWKRNVERKLESTHPDYYSKYSMVTFKPELSYYDAMINGRKQDECLLALAREKNYETMDPEEVYRRLSEMSSQVN